MRHSTRQYITSERFIHDDLLRDCAKLVDRLYNIWRREQVIRASLILFPSEYLKDSKGKTINGPVGMELDVEKERREAIAKAIAKTKAYAFFYVRTEGEEVLALLESPHGTRSWKLPIVRSVDIRVLGPAKIQDNVDTLELLWSKTQTAS